MMILGAPHHYHKHNQNALGKNTVKHELSEVSFKSLCWSNFNVLSTIATILEDNKHNLKERKQKIALDVFMPKTLTLKAPVFLYLSLTKNVDIKTKMTLKEK